MADERNLTTFPIWERYTVLGHHIMELAMKDRRHIFSLVRQTADASPDLFFPGYGFTLSEFAVWHIIGDSRRKAKKSQPSG
jgi:hypothetical protein